MRTRFLIGAAFLLAACGSSTSGGAAPGSAGGSTTTAAAPTTAGTTTTTLASTFPLTIHNGDRDVVVKAKPARIVSLSATGTEMLFAIGAGSQVAAVDDQSNFPTAAPKTDLSGLQPNVEAISKYDPDLVVVSDDSAGLSGSLGKLGVPVLVEPAATTLDDSYAQIQQLGQATGNTDGAGTTVATMKQKIAAIVKALPLRQTPLTYYHELDDTLYSVTSKTFIGQIYELLGLKSVADAADSAGTGYPQLSSEYLITANPDLIFLADTKCCQQNAQTLAARPGFDQLRAVKDGAVVLLDDDIASRWGPRAVDLMQAVADSVAKLRPAGG